MAKKSESKKAQTASKKSRGFGYCSACGSRQKINGICKGCGDTDAGKGKSKPSTDSESVHSTPEEPSNDS